MSRGIHCLIATAVALFAAGCGQLGVIWLPDSSGFIFAASSDAETFSIGRYDVKTSAARALREQTDTLVPAVSPDGKRIATVELVRDPQSGSAAIQIFVWTLEGKELSRSKLLSIGKEPAKGNATKPEGFTAVLWGPDNRFLVGYACGSEAVGLAGYSETSREWKVMAGVLPWTELKVTPILPDRSGIVAVHIAEENGGPRPVIVRVDGTIQNVRTADGKPIALQDHAALSAARWNSGALVFSYDDQAVRIDAARAVWTAKPMPPPSTQPAEVIAALRNQSPIVTSYTFPRTGVRVVCRTIEIKKERRGSLPHFSNQRTAHGYQIGVCKAGSDDIISTILDTDGDDDFLVRMNDPFNMLFPSPDGTLLAVRCCTQGSVDSIAIVDDLGRIRHTFRTASVFLKQ